MFSVYVTEGGQVVIVVVVVVYGGGSLLFMFKWSESNEEEEKGKQAGSKEGINMLIRGLPSIVSHRPATHM